ncbi:RNA polymerase sigma factor [uncultured Amnibacterium sp.]|uniref:RNA polymerase sigma factor n=1 Tax=uncultured Amnibacterium sp. TaxID=1631851 RepID=UPI0035CC83B0
MEPSERVVAGHGSAVWRVCRGLLNEHDAEDAWADTFAAALAAWGRSDQNANVRGWLVTIAHRKAIDVLRHRARDPLPVETVPERPSRYGVPGARDLDLWAALATLPPRQRAAVVHHHLGGLPYDEIAQLTGTTAAAARRAASDGVARLRAVLDPRPNPPQHPSRESTSPEPTEEAP